MGKNIWFWIMLYKSRGQHTEFNISWVYLWVSWVSCTGRQVLYQSATWEAPHRYLNHTDTPPSYILQYFSISSPRPVKSFCFFLQWSWFTSLSSIAICCCSGSKSCPTLCDPIAIVLNIFSLSCLLIWCNFSFTA